MHNFKELKLWKKSVDFSVDVYRNTTSFPKEEIYGLRAQIRNAAISVPSNISEGAGRNGNKEFLHFLSIANGSANEVETQILIAEKLGFMSDDQKSNIIIQLTELRKMIFAFSNKLRSDLK